MVNSLGNYYGKIRITFKKRPRTLIIICGFLFLRQERLHANIFYFKICALKCILYHALLSYTNLLPDGTFPF